MSLREGRIESLPSRERGLKSLHPPAIPRCLLSLPSRERGLKFLRGVYGPVAVGSLPSRERGLKLWDMYYDLKFSRVAPFTGAWIEIIGCGPGWWAPWSLPSRERGLKFYERKPYETQSRSLPSRERGLKSRLGQHPLVGGGVAPFTGAWIEI